MDLTLPVMLALPARFCRGDKQAQRYDGHFARKTLLNG
ncbi:unknown protein [Cronobacter turicensis z3032]|uniref:Uncharacterized protein n=1 Tax=Cronobacter turicensis (strain DSM 18703 / CCUG 55852 / LMG 23827 / z3032) TaxID=693216 RepID=C9Y048_CROTZ|nr:unknown protein [Cronobacter turicensis z3032]